MGEKLLAKGFKYDGPYPAMAVKLDELVDKKKKIQGFIHEVVHDEETCRTFWEIWSKGYPMPKQFANVACNASLYNGFDNVPNKHYLGYLNGDPVGTSMLLLAEGVAGVHDVTVLPSARGRGIGTEMSMLPLRDAVSHGYNYGVLCSTKQGLPMYRKLRSREYVQWDWYSKEF